MGEVGGGGIPASFRRHNCRAGFHPAVFMPYAWVHHTHPPFLRKILNAGLYPKKMNTINIQTKLQIPLAIDFPGILQVILIWR